MYDSLIFDLDGTLWDTTDIIKLTWNKILSDYPYIREPITKEELEKCMGLNLTEISRRLFPMCNENMQEELITKCCDLEVEILSQRGGSLYPTHEELRKLSQKLPLYIVSNCQSGYIESFFKGNNTSKYFKDFECAGSTGLSKGENIKLVMERNHLSSPAYMGDTAGDLEGAEVAGIPFIFASYGFGQAERYSHILQNFSGIFNII